MTDEYQKIRFPQRAGPTIKANKAKLICSESTFDENVWEEKWIDFAIYKTPSEKLIAVINFFTTDCDEPEAHNTEVRVVDPILLNIHGDVKSELEIQCEVMDLFGWRTTARHMVKKQLGWKLSEHID